MSTQPTLEFLLDGEKDQAKREQIVAAWATLTTGDPNSFPVQFSLAQLCVARELVAARVNAETFRDEWAKAQTELAELRKLVGQVRQTAVTQHSTLLTAGQQLAATTAALNEAPTKLRSKLDERLTEVAASLQKIPDGLYGHFQTSLNTALEAANKKFEKSSTPLMTYCEKMEEYGKNLESKISKWRSQSLVVVALVCLVTGGAVGGVAGWSIKPIPQAVAQAITQTPPPATAELDKILTDLGAKWGKTQDGKAEYIQLPPNYPVGINEKENAIFLNFAPKN